MYAQDKWTIKRLTRERRGCGSTTSARLPRVPPRARCCISRLGISRSPSPPGTTSRTCRRGSARRVRSVRQREGPPSRRTSSRYTIAADPSQGNPVARSLVNRVTRSWTDANQNYVPDCDLLNPLAQDLRASGGDFCGTLSDLRFGQAIPSQVLRSRPRSAGWGARPVQLGVLGGRAARSWRRASRSTSATSAASYRQLRGHRQPRGRRRPTTAPFSITAPVDARLPGGGGYAGQRALRHQPEQGRAGRQLRDAGAATTARRPSTGTAWTSASTRGRAAACCFRAASAPAAPRRTTAPCWRSCRRSPPSADRTATSTAAFLTQVKLLGTYTVPKVDVQLAATFQSLPGPQHHGELRRHQRAQVQPSLGRALSGGAANATVNIVAPGTMYGERLNQLDLRFVKTHSVRPACGRRPQSRHLYNALNGNAVRTVNNNYASLADAHGDSRCASVQDQRAGRFLRGRQAKG